MNSHNNERLKEKKSTYASMSVTEKSTQINFDSRLVRFTLYSAFALALCLLRYAFEFNKWCANAWPPRFCQNLLIFHSLCFSVSHSHSHTSFDIHVLFFDILSLSCGCCCPEHIFFSAVHLLTPSSLTHLCVLCVCVSVLKTTLHHDALKNTFT